jgi:hypothetical protein
MARASEQALAELRELLRQLRGIKGLTEKSSGIFYWKAHAFVHFHEETREEGQRAILADIKKVPGTGFDRMSVDTPEQQRKLVDEAKKRVKRLEDD